MYVPSSKVLIRENFNCEMKFLNTLWSSLHYFNACKYLKHYVCLAYALYICYIKKIFYITIIFFNCFLNMLCRNLKFVARRNLSRDIAMGRFEGFSRRCAFVVELIQVMKTCYDGKCSETRYETLSLSLSYISHQRRRRSNTLIGEWRHLINCFVISRVITFSCRLIV